MNVQIIYTILVTMLDFVSKLHDNHIWNYNIIGIIESLITNFFAIILLLLFWCNYPTTSYNNNNDYYKLGFRF